MATTDDRELSQRADDPHEWQCLRGLTRLAVALIGFVAWATFGSEEAREQREMAASLAGLSQDETAIREALAPPEVNLPPRVRGTLEDRLLDLHFHIDFVRGRQPSSVPSFPPVMFLAIAVVAAFFGLRDVIASVRRDRSIVKSEASP